MVVFLGKHRGMSSHKNRNFPTNLLILNDKNNDNWCKRMKVVFCYQDVWDLVKNGVTPISEDTMDE